MKKFSSKRAALERAYKKALKEIIESHHGRIICAGCYSCQGMISPSHRVARSRNINLIADKDNIDLLCDTCHKNIESLDWHLLEICEEVENYVREHDFELYEMYLIKRHAS